MHQYASPLFILRKACAEDLFGVLDRIAALGFDGVEFLGFFGHSPRRIRAHLDGLGLACVGNHVPHTDFVRDADRVIDDHAALDAQCITLGELPDFSDTSGIDRWAEKARAAGMTLLYHNHAREFLPEPSDRHPLDDIMAAVPGLSLEPDVGWMHIAGVDPLCYLRRYRDRAPVIHFKDYVPGTDDRPLFRPVGYGVVNHPRLIGAALSGCCRWLVADHDCAYGRDPYAELGMSLRYMKELVRLWAAADQPADD